MNANPEDKMGLLIGEIVKAYDEGDQGKVWNLAGELSKTDHEIDELYAREFPPEEYH